TEPGVDYVIAPASHRCSSTNRSSSLWSVRSCAASCAVTALTDVDGEIVDDGRANSMCIDADSLTCADGCGLRNGSRERASDPRRAFGSAALSAACIRCWTREPTRCSIATKFTARAGSVGRPRTSISLRPSWLSTPMMELAPPSRLYEGPGCLFNAPTRAI